MQHPAALSVASLVVDSKHVQNCNNIALTAEVKGAIGGCRVLKKLEVEERQE